jgi:hypothetical protein
MKGIFFQKSLEYKLVIQGESWHQGECLKGTLEVKNHGTESVMLSELRILFANGVEKKAKAKEEGAYDVIATLHPAEKTLSLAPGEKSPAFAWEFLLDEKARVTEKSGGFYVLYGPSDSEDLYTLGQLQLQLKPRVIFEDFRAVLEAHYGFVTKQVKSGKEGTVKFKFSPREGGDFTSIDHLLLALALEGDELEADFGFTVKELDRDKPGFAFKKVKKSLKYSYTPSEYLLSFNQRLNKDKMEKAFGDVLKEAGIGTLI